MKKLLAFVLALAMVLSMTACGGQTDNSSKAPEGSTAAPTPGTTAAPTEGTEAPTEPAPAEAPTYTYNAYSSALANNWNPHTWETNADSGMFVYLTSPLVDYTILDSEEGLYQYTYDMAISVTDVTKDNQADLEKYAINLPAGETVADQEYGYVYELKLRPEACWADGTKITADDYVYSLQQLLAPEMHNYRANNYISGEYAWAGAAAYYYAGSTAYIDTYGAFALEDLTKGEDGQYVNADGQLIFIGLDFPLDWTGGDTLKDYVDYYGDALFDITNWDALVAEMDENGLIPLTDENLDLFKPVTCGNPGWGETEEDLPNYLVYAQTYGEASFDSVGFYKVDDYTVRIVLENRTGYNYFIYSIAGAGGNWIVYKDLYEAGKDTSGELVTTDYGTTPETTMSYGPYQFESMQADKQMIFVQNPNWYGWEQGEDGTLVSYTEFEVDGEVQQQWRTTRVVIDVMDDTAAKQAFLKGELTEWVPTAEDLLTYAASDQLYKAPETYTMRFFFNCNLDALKAMDESKGNTNSVVLSSTTFRKAMSLAIDRGEFVKATEGYIPNYGILNDLYYYNIFEDPASSYRSSDEAMQAICDMYGVEYGEGKPYATLKDAYESINGYNLTEAKALFTEACKELVEAGLYKEGDDIYVRIGYKKGAIDSAEQNQVTLLNQMMNAALEGTGFGKFTFEAVGNIENRYADTAKGEFAMGWGAWGGNAFGPFSIFRVYFDVDYMGGIENIHEGGSWDPSKTSLTLNVDGEDITMTWQEWSNSLIGTGRFADESADPDFKTRLGILAQLEGQFLNLYYCIPMCATSVPELLSFKNTYFTEDYNIMYGFGGLQLLKYNYDDAEWLDFVKSQGGELHYE